MFRFSSSNSISKKLVQLVSIITAGAVFFVLLITTVNDVITAHIQARAHLDILAEMAARNSAPAIMFSDKMAAEDALTALQAHRQVLHAELFNKDGRSFASYAGADAKRGAIADRLGRFNVTTVDYPVSMYGESLGVLRMTVSLDDMWHGVSSRWVVNIAGLTIAFLVCYLLLRRATRKILQPIEQLASVMRGIIDHKEYSVRVEKTSDDELGELTDEFNQMLAQIELRDSKLRQSSEALAQTQDAITLRDTELRIQYVNPAFTVLFGFHLEEIQGKAISLMPEHPPEPQLGQEEIYDIAKENGVYRGDVYRQSKSGKIIPISLQISPVRDEKGHLTGYVTVLSDITEKKQAEEWIWQQANFDTLTGLPNRHMFYERLRQEILRTNRTQVPFALMFLDLDHFKEVNDSLGHDIGDELLKETAERLLSCVRNTDSVGHVNAVSRLGGDEFTIILNDLKEINNVEKVAQRILDKLGEPYYLRGEMVYISASLGITLYPKDAQDAETLVKHADQTMYHAKNKGRNNFSYFTRSMQIAAQKRRTMVNDLRVAIEQKQFRVVYQPIVDLTTQQICKAEALIRWDHPGQGLVSPAEFIPVAEETGMIVEIGDQVFYQAVEQVAKWRKSLHEHFQISINKSPVQFLSKSSRCLEWFDYMKELGLPGDCLAIEITEGLMLDQNTLVSDKLLAFRDAGVQVAVDDFGTGYSSLSYLKRFDIDFIKIDKSFVQNLSIHSEDMVLCEAIIVMAHKMGLKVVAEGIETAEQRDLLFGIGCDYGQGYYFSRPLPVDGFERLVGEQKNVVANNTLLQAHDSLLEEGYP